MDNRLTLSPRVDIVDIRKRIEDALKRNAEVDAKDIHVRVDGDVVRLDGKVHLWRERKLVERAAWSVPASRGWKITCCSPEVMQAPVRRLGHPTFVSALRALF